MSSMRITGWRRLIECLELQVIFRKIAADYRALLRKMTCNDKASYDSTPPCITTLNVPVFLNCLLLLAATRCNTLQHTATNRVREHIGRIHNFREFI